jgi:hypothetical protein
VLTLVVMLTLAVTVAAATATAEGVAGDGSIGVRWYSCNGKAVLRE